MDADPILEGSLDVPQIGYSLSARLRPAPIKTTLIRLLPWALYAAVPRHGRLSKLSLSMAQRFSPLMKQKMGGK